MIKIFVPTIRVGNIEVLVENDTPQESAESDDDNDDDDNDDITTTDPKRTTSSTFHFHATPYFLKLRFAPYQFSEAAGDDSVGNIPALYDPSTQQVVVRLAKAEPGTFWTNLDMTARLLQPKKIPKQWLHAVTTNDERGADHISHDDDDDDDETPTVEGVATPATSDGQNFGYGFGGIFQNIFTDYCRGGLAQEMLQLPTNPERTAPHDRRAMRHEKEMEDFDEGRYLGDLFISTEDYMYPMVMEYVPFWRADKTNSASLLNQMGHLTINDVGNASSSSSSSSPLSSFTSDERLQLASIPYPLLPKARLDFRNSSTFWPGLLDLLIPFVYDHLTTMGDPSVESAWTIATLSCSLSWLDSPFLSPPSPPSSSSSTTTSIITTNHIYDTIVQVTRRMLIYPYWRNFEFCHHVLQETLSLLTSGGIHAVVKALLRIRTILDKSESYYVGNKIFVDPFLYCIQQTAMIPVSVIEGLKDVLLKEDGTSILKSALHLDLDRIEGQENACDSESCSTDHEDDDEEEDGEDDSSNSNSSSSSCSDIEDQQEGMKEESKGNNSNPAPAFDKSNQGDAPPNPLVLLDSIVGTGGNSMLSVINRHAIVDDGGDQPATAEGNIEEPIEVHPTPLPEGTQRKPLIQEIS